METLVPERHLFMGGIYLYGRIVSVFGRNGVKGRKGAGRIMKYMMLSSMMKGKDGGFSAMLPLMLGMKGDFGFMEDLFDGDDEDDTPDEKEA